jgi:long-chain acyl-CoA synthetase
VQAALTAVGAQIGFFQGDTLKLMEDIKELRPTVFVSVPRLYNRIYDRVLGGAAEAGGIKAAMFTRAFEGKRFWLKQNYLHHSVWDPLVFDKVKARVGLDRVRLMVTGSAPLAAHVSEFLRIVFGAPLVEGYGQTECSAAATATAMCVPGVLPV